MRTCFLFILLFSCSNVFAQRKIVVEGVIKDSITKAVLRDITVYEENNPANKVISNRLGKFYLTINLKENEFPVIVVKSIMYDTTRHKFSKSDIRNLKSKDTLFVSINLNFLTLAEFVKSAAPDTVFGSKQLSVSDFEFHGENFVMLVYERRLDKGSKVIYVDKNQNVLSSFTVPDIAKSLYKDFTGKIHVVCEKKVYQIEITDNVMQFYPIKNDFFESQVKPWVDTAEAKAYMSNFVWYYPQFDYYVYGMEDSTFKKLYTVTDKPLMQLYRAQYKYVDGQDKVQAMKAELATGVDKEIWIAIWTGFPNSIYYKQLYAPMFVKEDTVLIFDHYSNKMYRFNSENNPIDTIDINYHLGYDKKSWEEQLLKDPITNSIYSLFLREGNYYLKELNTSTGEIMNSFKLAFRYPEKIKVNDGYVYYIYRPYESAQKKFLYKEKISY